MEEGGANQIIIMKTIQVQARRCGKNAKINKLQRWYGECLPVPVIKPRSIGSTTLSMKAWDDSRAHIKQLNDEVVPSLRGYHVAYDLAAPGRDHTAYVRVFLPWK